MDNKKAQEEEIEVIKAIFDQEFEAIDFPATGGTLLISVDVTEHFKVTWNEPGEDSDDKEMNLQYLPPLTLIVRFPDNYPFGKPPDFTLICDWLSGKALEKLGEAMSKIWETTKDVIIYKWSLFLKEESMSFLHLNSQLNISALLKRKKNRDPSRVTIIGGILTSEIKFEITFPDAWDLQDEFEEFVREALATGHIAASPEAMPDTPRSTLNSLRRSVSTLPDFLKTYNYHKDQEKFTFLRFECPVCYLTAFGKHGVRFDPCGHVFCKMCVKTYLEVAIKDGRVESLHCLALDCSSPVIPDLVKSLVSSKLFNSYDQLLYSVTLSVMGNVIHCPRPLCQEPVFYDPADQMAVCPSCEYAFCHYCRMGYHALEQCQVRARDKENMIKMYLEAGDEVKRELEKKYGKKNLQLQVDNFLTKQWIECNSKPCPQCKARIEKRDGCNKITCWRCMAAFCWICRKHITSSNPYDHFLDGSTKCYGKLFQ